MTSPIVHDYDSAEHAAALGFISVEEYDRKNATKAEDALGLFEKALIVGLGIVCLLCAVSPALFS